MRLFIGIDLPEEIKQSLLSLQSELKQLGVDGSWKSQDNFHITLEFLAELDRSSIPIIIESMSSATRNHRPFMLEIGELGAFPSLKRPHTLWSAVGGSLIELNQMRDEIHAELADRGFNLENRKFIPHITLASRPNLRGVSPSDLQTKKRGQFMVNEVTLFESSVIQGKRTYTGIDKKRLQ
jgi:RNA 2',3'-cyclic 3'-phosphodiesterase